MAQQLVQKKGFKKHDWRGTANMAFYGGGMLHRIPFFTRAIYLPRSFYP